MNGLERAPYPGLRPFERAENYLFFGRDNSIEAMIARLAATRFLAVLGSSGTGKSSLVKTGLLTGLEMGLLPRAGSDWRIVDFRPGVAPLRNLADTLLRSQETEDGERYQPTPGEVEDLRKRLSVGGPRELIKWCREGHLAEGTNLLLLVDQFEELFRYETDAGRQEAEIFVSLLLESRRPIEVDYPQEAVFPIFVTLTMRSEYLGACALIEGLAEAVNEGSYLTPRMTRSQCREAIVGPARVCGVEVEDRLVTQLLNDLANFASFENEQQSADPEHAENSGPTDQLSRIARRADQLPLMQHALNRMWYRAKARAKPGEGVWLRADDFKGLKGELNNHTDEIMERLGEERRPAVETIFRALTDGKTPGEARRRHASFGELVELCGGEPARQDVTVIVDAFSARGVHFLTRASSTGAPADEADIEISHESLIRQWGLLSGWLEKEAQVAHEWQKLDQEAEDYFSANPPRPAGGIWRLPASTGRLLSGLRLSNALTLREQDPKPAWGSRYKINLARIGSFVGLSKTWRNWRWGAGAVVGVVVAGVLLWLTGLYFGERTATEAANARVTAERENAEVQKLLANVTKENVANSRQARLDTLRNEAGALADVLKWAPPSWAPALYRKQAANKLRLGDFDGARADIDRAMLATGDYLPDLLFSSDLYVVTGDADAAIATAQQYIAVVPTGTIAYRNLILGEAMRRDYAAAIAAIKVALEKARLPVDDTESSAAPDILQLTGGASIVADDSDVTLALKYLRAGLYAMSGDQQFEAEIDAVDTSDADRPNSKQAYLLAANWLWLTLRGQALYDLKKTAALKDRGTSSRGAVGLKDYGVYAIEGALWHRIAASDPRARPWAVQAYQNFRDAYAARPDDRYKALDQWVARQGDVKFTRQDDSVLEDARDLARKASELHRGGPVAAYAGDNAVAFQTISRAIDLLVGQQKSKNGLGRRERDLLVRLYLLRANWRLQGVGEVDKGGARDDANAARALDANSADAYGVLARAAFDDTTRKLNDETGLQLAPGNIGILQDLVRFNENSNPELALDYLTQLSRLHDGGADDLIGMSRLQMKLNRQKEASESLESAIARAPWGEAAYAERYSVEMSGNGSKEKAARLHFVQGLHAAAAYYAQVGDDADALRIYVRAFREAAALEAGDDADFETGNIVRSLTSYLARRFNPADAQRFWQDLSVDPTLDPRQQQFAKNEAQRLAAR